MLNILHHYLGTKLLKKIDPVYFEDVEINDTKKIFIDIIESVKVIINRANLIYPGGTELQISHHYGIQNFHQTGTTIIPVINREYCKVVFKFNKSYC